MSKMVEKGKIEEVYGGLVLGVKAVALPRDSGNEISWYNTSGKRIDLKSSISAGVNTAHDITQPILEDMLRVLNCEPYQMFQRSYQESSFCR